ncbi:MAG: hypothetical protein HY586_00715, partial [Candidatus Omnitrophica bacterium]|nr:hypothetical protein [Candidatus Omnitrophota bacterium]
DVERSYPLTPWAEKARDKIQRLRDPEKFLKQRADLIEAKQHDIEQRQRGIAEREAELEGQQDIALEQILEIEKAKLKDLKKSVRQEESRFERNKKESIRLRRRALQRDKKELKRKEKVLVEKRKLLKFNPSESLRRALDRWSDSLEFERYSLYRQETAIVQLEEKFGIRHGAGPLGFLPFMGQRQNLDATLRYKYKDFDALVRQWEKIKERKTKILSKRRQFEGELAAVGPWDAEEVRKNEDVRRKIAEQNPEWLEMERQVQVEETDLGRLEEKYDTLGKQIQKLQGSLLDKAGQVIALPVALSKVPVKMIGGALDKVNPFKANVSGLSGTDQFLEMLREKQRLEKEIAQIRSGIETIQNAFEEELASDILDNEASLKSKPQDQKEKVEAPLAAVEEKESSSRPAKQLSEQERHQRIALKKQIKQLERQIRRRYEEIEDRQASKNKKLDQLAQLLRDKQSSGFLGPVGGTAKGTVSLVRMFIFGMKDEEKQMYQEAGKIQKEPGDYSTRAGEFKSSIELDNLMIEAHGREIETLKRELEVLKAQAATLDGFAFRSIIIERPGNAIEETVEEASNMIPAKDKKSVLIHRLDEETRKQALLEVQSAQIETWLRQNAPQAVEVEKKALEPGPVPGREPKAPEAAQAKKELAPQSSLSAWDTALPSKKDEGVDARKTEVEKLFHERNDLNLLIQNKRERVLEMKEALSTELRNWTEVHQTGLPSIGGKQSKKVRKLKKKLSHELTDVDKKLNRLRVEEQKTLEKQKSLYEEKLEHLNQTIESMKHRADDRYELLVAEKETVARRMEQTSRALNEVISQENLSSAGLPEQSR